MRHTSDKTVVKILQLYKDNAFIPLKELAKSAEISELWAWEMKQRMHNGGLIKIDSQARNSKRVIPAYITEMGLRFLEDNS